MDRSWLSPPQPRAGASVLRYQSRTQIPSATSPITVLAYCRAMYIGISPSSGTLTQRCSQTQRHHGQEKGG